MKKKNKKTIEIDTTYFCKILSKYSDFGADELNVILKAVREDTRIQGTHYNPITGKQENDK